MQNQGRGLPQILLFPRPPFLSGLPAAHSACTQGERVDIPFVLLGDSWLLGYYQQGSLTRRLRLITESLINGRKLVLEQYPEE